MTPHDFSAVRCEVAQAARRAFTRVRAENSGERFYALALYSDDGAMTVSPAANSEEGYERCLQRYRGDPSFMEFLAEYNLAFCPFNYRWNTSEWAYCFRGVEEFDAVHNLIGVDRPDEESDEEGFVSFKGGLFAAMLLGLKDLDAEGFFGTGDERARVTLLCSATDCHDAAWFEEESARRLNPPAVYREFFDQWKTNPVMAENYAEHLAEPNEVYLAFSDALEAGW